MGDTLSRQAWWHNLPRSQPCILFSGGGNGWCIGSHCLPCAWWPPASSYSNYHLGGMWDSRVKFPLTPLLEEVGRWALSPGEGTQSVGAGFSAVCVFVWRSTDILQITTISPCNQPPCLQTPNMANMICMVCLQCKLVSKGINVTWRSTEGGLGSTRTNGFYLC